MKQLRQVIRQLIIEAFTEEDVDAATAADTRDYGPGKWGANAKDIFRQQREADPAIDDICRAPAGALQISIPWLA